MSGALPAQREPRAFDRANAFQRALRTIAATGPGAWFFARVLHRIDRPVHRLTRGRHTFGALVSGLPVVMLTTTGARSGARRTVPLLGLPTPDGLAVIGSNFGRRHHPAWVHNLQANPRGEVTVRGHTWPFHATEATGDARDRAWQAGLQVYPGFTQYERRASHRRIKIFLLNPR